MAKFRLMNLFKIRSKLCSVLWIFFGLCVFVSIKTNTQYNSFDSNFDWSLHNIIVKTGFTKFIFTNRSVIDDLRPTSERRLLTWFTTFKKESTRDSIQNSILVNRGKLTTTNDGRWTTQPVLFLTNETREFGEMALQNGWHIHDVPKYNEFGIPFIGDMVDVIMKAPYNDSVFFGFANGDMLFDQSLLATMMSVMTQANGTSQSEKPTQTLKTPILIIGFRTSCITHSYWSKHRVIVSDLYQVEQLRKSCSLGRHDMIDYFIFTADFPRKFFEGLVIGRPGYDNFVVAASIRHQLTVIDATRTTTAVHLRTPNPNIYSNDANNTLFNREKLKGYANMHLGFITRAPYETNFSVDCLCITTQRRLKYWNGDNLKPIP